MRNIAYILFILFSMSLSGQSVIETLNNRTGAKLFSCNQNVALYKYAEQSSKYGDGEPDYANDGNTSGNSPWNTEDANLQHTTNETNPWWQVDLGFSQVIDHITVYNRSDGFQTRLTDFYIHVSPTPFGEASLATILADGTITSTYHSGDAGAIVEFDDVGTGRYVRIQLSAAGILHVAEVDIFSCFRNESSGAIPVITLTGDNPLNYDVDDTYSEPGATATDAEDGSLTGSIVIDATDVNMAAVGTYYVTYNVTDSDSNDAAEVQRVVNVTDPTPPGSGCVGNGGGGSTTAGLKSWCWNENQVPSYNAKTATIVSGQIGIDNECNPQVSNTVNDELRFFVDPDTPAAQGWCNNSFNLRAEIRTLPWPANHVKGTEEWVGFNYRFGDGYQIQPTGGNNWIIWQVHDGTIGASPQLSLQIDQRTASSYSIGELVTVNAAQPIGNNSNTIVDTDIIPVAEQTLKIVMYIKWDDEANGVWKVWIDDVLVLDQQQKTVRDANQVGGNMKFGIYNHVWRNQSGVDASIAAGITDIETFLGPLKIFTAKSGDTGYGVDQYSTVEP